MYDSENKELEIDVEHLAGLISSWYVRRDSKFYDVDRPTAKLSKDDVQRACLVRLAGDPCIGDREVLKQAFARSIEQKHGALGQTIPV